MPLPVTVGATITSCGRIKSGNYVFNNGGDIVYLGSDPVSVYSANGGIVLYPATAVQWENDGYLYAICPAGTNPTILVYRDTDGVPGVIPFSAGELIIPTGLHSGNYVAGTSGWRIAKDGTVEFNSGIFRGSIIVGPPTGKRIEINVTAGVITMYDSANNITGQWDSVNQRFLIGIPTGAQVQLNAGGRNIQLLTAGLATNAVLAVDDTNGFTVTMFGAGQRITLNNNLIVSGIINATMWTVNNTTNFVIGPSGSGNISIMSISPTLPAAGWYVVSASWFGVLPGAASTSTFRFLIQIDGTTVQQSRNVTQATNVTQCGGAMFSDQVFLSAGSHTFTLLASQESGTGTMQVSGASTAPIVMKVSGV